MTDLARAKELLRSGDYTLAMVKGERELVSRERGVKPLLGLLEADVSGYTAADRVVGKAAAFLYVLLGVSAVYAEVLSDPAEGVLLRHGIPVSCVTHTDRIVNRTKSGLCPMESAVAGIDDPNEALAAIRTRLKELNNPST